MFYSLVSGGGYHSRGEHHWESLKGRVSDVRQLKKKLLQISLLTFLYQHSKIKLEQGFPGSSDS